MVNLSNLSVAELRELQTQIADQIKTRQKDEIAKVQQQILSLAGSVGMSVNEIMKGVQNKKPVKSVAARYQNPADSAQQWTGRGRQPKWVKEYLDKPGNKIDSLLIQ
jgi:DNA-binding protein H-NS